MPLSISGPTFSATRRGRARARSLPPVRLRPRDHGHSRRLPSAPPGCGRRWRQRIPDREPPGPTQPQVGEARRPEPHRTPIAARLSRHIDKWREVTQNHWVLSTVEHGLDLELIGTPLPLGLVPKPVAVSQAEAVALDQEVARLQVAGAVVPLPCRLTEAFFSNIFGVPKSDGGTRLVHSLRRLNVFVPYRHFKMTGLCAALALVSRGCHMATIDLEKAYFTVGVRRDQWRFLAFRWRDRDYAFPVMAFGLSSAPRVFTKLLKPLLAYLREQGVLILNYIDDLLIVARSRAQCLLHLQWTLDLFHRVGFSIHPEKGQLSPSRRVKFLGFIIDSQSMTVELPPDKLQALNRSLRKTTTKVQQGMPVGARSLARLLGRLAQTAPAVLRARLYTRELYSDLNGAHHRAWDAPVRLGPLALQELVTWLQFLPSWNGRSFILQNATIWMTTDASAGGWGAWIGMPGSEVPLATTFGFWSAADRRLLTSSNQREFQAVFLGAKAFRDSLRGERLLVRSDNTATVACLNQQGGPIPVLNRLSRETLEFLWSVVAEVHAVHLPGVVNCLADGLSRLLQLADPRDYKLNPAWFRAAERLWGRRSIDLFATMANAQVPTFAAGRPDPEAVAIDAMMLDWNPSAPFMEAPWANPPFIMILRVLLKIQQDRATVALCLPLWPGALWFPLLPPMLADFPRLLPVQQDIFLPGYLGSEASIGPPPWRVIVCLLSGDERRTSVFRRRLWRWWRARVGRAPPHNMTVRGAFGLHGRSPLVEIPLFLLTRTSWDL